MYPDSDIVFDNDPTRNYELSIVYNNEDDTSIPFIYYICEANNVINYDLMDMSNNIYSVVSTQYEDVINKPNTYYLPSFTNVGAIIRTSSPFVRDYTNNKRPFLAAYIAKHSPPHRDKMFKALYALDPTVDGLGEGNHTKNIDLPPQNVKSPTKEKGWWALSKIYKDYKFGFAMENTYDDGYISEKIMNIYRGGAIPLYWGTSKVKEIFNPDSFVYLNDYSSYNEAAKDIVAISKDNKRLQKMLNAPIFLENLNPDYSKYYDTPSPKWVVDIANTIKSRLTKMV